MGMFPCQQIPLRATRWETEKMENELQNLGSVAYAWVIRAKQTNITSSLSCQALAFYCAHDTLRLDVRVQSPLGSNFHVWGGEETTNFVLKSSFARSDARYSWRGSKSSWICQSVSLRSSGTREELQLFCGSLQGFSDKNCYLLLPCCSRLVKASKVAKWLIGGNAVFAKFLKQR